MKKWEVRQLKIKNVKLKIDDIIKHLLENRDIKTKAQVSNFLKPPNPYNLNPLDVGIERASLDKALKRILKAIKSNESIVVYADYDADGITAGAIMWETLHVLGANVMPYIPHRVEEGYGLSIKGIDSVIEQFKPTVIITVDHGITAWEKVAYAKKLGIDVIVTDHHVKPKKLPECMIVHTTKLSGAGISWFVAKELLEKNQRVNVSKYQEELVALAAIGTIADMMPLVGVNRSIAKFGLMAINKTIRVGLNALINESGLVKGELGTYDVSHVLAPRLNAMGRIEHALDALRLLCTHDKEKAQLLAQKLGITNRERQQMTVETAIHAIEFVKGLSLHRQDETLRKLLFVSHESYNQGVIGLVAGKLVEEFYRPAIVVSKGEEISKASARSISGFNIVEAIQSCSDILIDVGGHPMAAGFTVATKHLVTLQDRLEKIADKELTKESLTRTLRIDAEIPLETVTEELWTKLRDFEPFGFGNPEPVFATRGVQVVDTRLVGKDGKHLKLRVSPSEKTSFWQASHRARPESSFDPGQARMTNTGLSFDAIAFSFGHLYEKLRPKTSIDIVYTIDLDTWNGNRRLQLKVKDIKFN